MMPIWERLLVYGREVSTRWLQYVNTEPASQIFYQCLVPKAHILTMNCSCSADSDHVLPLLTSVLDACSALFEPTCFRKDYKQALHEECFKCLFP